MQINIRDLMENIEDSSVDLEEKDVVSSDKIKELTKMKINEYGFTNKRSSKKKFVTVLIAAAVVSAAGISAFAAFRGGLEDIAFGKPENTTVTESIVIPSAKGKDKKNSKSAKNTKPTESKTPVALQGYSDSNGFKASKEWREFEDNYDQDWKIVDAYEKQCKKTGKDIYEEKYPGYGIYSKEMADKVEELLKKYNLKLRGKEFEEDEKTLTEKYGNIFTDITGTGYGYEDGTFHLDAKYKNVDFQIRRCMDGSFDTVYYADVGNINTYEQWRYTTKDGAEITIAKRDDNNMIIAKTPKGFVVMNMEPCDDEWGEKLPPLTKAELEDFADHIHFNNL